MDEWMDGQIAAQSPNAPHRPRLHACGDRPSGIGRLRSLAKWDWPTAIIGQVGLAECECPISTDRQNEASAAVRDASFW
jgi:hypothetical protein